LNTFLCAKNTLYEELKIKIQLIFYQVSCTTINPNWNNHLLEMINLRQIQGSKILPRPGIELQSPSSQSHVLTIRPQRPLNLCGVLVENFWVNFLLLGQGQVSHLWFEFGFRKFAIKIPNFSMWVKKYLIGSGQKVPGSKTCLPLFYCGSKVCSSRVWSEHISTLNGIITKSNLSTRFPCEMYFYLVITKFLQVYRSINSINGSMDL